MTAELVQLEPWLDKRGMCDYLKCSPRWLADRMVEGLPRARIAGRVKFRASECERWLAERGHLEREGDAA